jgi:hypothetical protein
MTAPTFRTPPEVVPVDGYTMADVRWLLVAVSEFLESADLDAVHDLITFADPHLSPDGLANVVADVANRVQEQIEEARCQ